MMYWYTTLGDGTEVTYSHVMERNGIQFVEVHFERAIERGFDSARCVLPEFRWKFCDGYTADELEQFMKLIRINWRQFFCEADADC